jgi:predicted nucleic acid-binding protein
VIGYKMATASKLPTLNPSMSNAPPIRFHGHDSLDFVMEAIERTVARLPKRVQELVRKDMAFVAVGDTVRGHTIPNKFLYPAWGRGEEGWLTVLDASYIRSASENETDFLVAHEIAHRTLNHSGSASKQEEDEANEQARQWGFTNPE